MKLRKLLLPILISVAMVLMFFAPNAKASSFDTSAYVVVNPNPVGVGQTVEIAMNVLPLPPLGTVLSGFRINITTPDGSVQSFGPYSSDSNGAKSILYMPLTVGNYNIRFFYSGEYFSSDNNTYLSSASSPVTLTVQAEPVSVQLSIRSSGSGTTTPTVGDYSFAPGNVATVLARPNTGWAFSYWQLNNANFSSNNSINLTMFSNKNLTAVFSAVPSYILNISVSGSGSTSIGTGVRSYTSGTSVTVTATPDSGWAFSNWLLNGVNASSASTILVVMDSNKNLTAEFVQQTMFRPSALIDFIEPNIAEVGQEVQFSGHGNDPDGEVVGYRWASNIDGLLSTSSSFATSSLSEGTHVIAFEVQDNDGSWSIENQQTVVVEVTHTLSILIIAVAVIAASIGTISFVLILLHFRPGTFRFVNRILFKPKPDEGDSENEDKEKEKERKNYSMELKSDISPRISKKQSYQAQITIKNIGSSKINNILVTASSTPGISMGKIKGKISVLNPGKDQSRVFPFKTDEQIDKGLYVVRFDVKSDKTPNEIELAYSIAAKIGVLALGEESGNKDLDRWLGANSYFWSKLSKADDLDGALLDYDLLILAPETHLTPNWTNNISKFVKSGNSLFVIGEVTTSNQKLFADILGMRNFQLTGFKFNRGLFTVLKPHSILSGLNVDDQMTLESSESRKIVSEPTVGSVLVSYSDSNFEFYVPVITVNHYGKGSVVLFNFQPEFSSPQVSVLLKNTIEWLIAQTHSRYLSNSS